MAPSAPHPAGQANLPGLLAAVHASALIVFLSWRFGGMDPSSRTVAGWVSGLAPLVTALAWRRADAALRRKFLGVALPLAGIALLVLTSALNPNMRVLRVDGEMVLGPRDDFLRFLPSTAWPRAMVPDFLLNAGLVLVGLNLFLARPTRVQQRLLLAVVAVNAATLAGVGSVFKLTHATTILGTFPSPNENFFATFFYPNHWAGFALLGAAAAAGLALHVRNRAPRNEWMHTPAPALGVLAVILFVSLPLSGSRAALLAGIALALALAVRLRSRRSRRGLRLASIAAVLAMLAGAAFWLARDRMQFLWRKTSGQLAEVRAGGMGDARLQIYRETWQLFLQRPVFGWGWHSYRYAFRRVQKFDFKMQNEQREKTLVLDAHNDWLQLLAELGLAGGALATAALVGLGRTATGRCWRLSPSYELAAGAGSVGLLACVDFPFACPAIVVTWWSLLATAGAIAYDRAHPEEPA
jgi:O-antigen ligase